MIAILCVLCLMCPVSLAAVYEKIKRGDKGDKVFKLQTALVHLGYDLKIDSSYGEATENAVREFQTIHQLTVDGIAGNETQTLLYALAENAAVNTPAVNPNRLEKGDEGEAVVKLQTALKKLGYSVTADGKFGDATRSAVKSFQRTHSLTVDGIAGVQTQQLLYSLAGLSPARATPTPLPTATPRGSVPTAAPTGSYSRLERGSTGEEVVRLQTALKALGFSITIDGNYSYATQNAVKSFQKKYGLGTDGIAGPITQEALYRYAGYVSVATPAPTRIPTQAPTAPAVTPVSESAIPAWVTDTIRSLNLRILANDTAAVITEIPAGTRITVTHFDAVWCKVLYENLAGYVMTKYLVFGSAPSATAIPTAVPTVVPTAVPTVVPTQVPSGTLTLRVTTSGGSLNMRSYANAYAYILTTIPNGTGLVCTEYGPTWCRVSYNGQTGYVMTSFVTVVANQTTPVPTATPSPVPTAVPGGKTETAIVTTTGGSLNFRAAAQSGAAVIATIPNGTLLQVISRGTGWTNVLYNGQSGYVMTSFLSFLSPSSTASPTPAPASSQSQYATVNTTGSSLNLRSGPGTSYKILANIPCGSTVFVTSRGSEWSGVVYAGIAGYVSDGYLSYLSADVTPAPSASPSEYTRTLRSGMTGEDVKWVQTRLAALKYTVAVTGVYDDQTIAAVREFQSQNGLTSDGLAGSVTFTMLRSANARSAMDKPLSYSTLRIDDTGSGVSNMQRELKALGYNLTVTGTYDTNTHNAVVAFQQRNDLVISGIADSLTLSMLYSGSANSYSTPVTELEAGAGRMDAPSNVQLLHWYNEVKPSIKSGQTILIYDPNTGLSWNLQLYSLGHHADSQPLTWRDTQIMNRSFGSTSWTVHPVYVKLPDGRWTMATMHNRPHLYGSITNNGFGGHLCVHFLRDMDECKANDPDYGVTNQNTLRKAWKMLTGITIN